ncbi:MAG TPA: MFS transporter [Candidatus Saccharimonadales bacterium]|jgi:MFS family permease|nr:MFS transporter [Candidatus Saccharimonadales bacterium]
MPHPASAGACAILGTNSLSDNQEIESITSHGLQEMPGFSGSGPEGTAASTAEEAGISAGTSSLPRVIIALRHRDFRLFWSGNFLSNIGTWMQNVAQGWLVLELTNSPFWLGVVSFAATFPILLLALVGGVIADHVDKRRLLIYTQSAMMVFAFMMAALAYTHHIKVWGIALLAMGTGIAMALTTPSYQALVPQLVPREELANAIALNAAQFNMSRVVGPTLGGFAMALVGVSGNFFLNGLSYMAVIIALSRIRYGSSTQLEEGQFWQKLKQGFRYVFGHEEMKLLVWLSAISSLLAVPYLAFAPYFAREILHTNARGLGILMACSGLGAFLAAVSIAFQGRGKRRGRFVVFSGLGFYASIIIFTFSRSFKLSCALSAIAGYCMILMVATLNTLLQHLAEDEMRGRVMSIYSTAFLGLPPIGSLSAGFMTHYISAPHAIAGMSAVAFAATVALFAGKKALRYLD